jgi:phosphatidylserine decarboxylase
MAVCIGAMMVGSIKTTVSEGDFVKRGQEFGYFAFGVFFFPGRGDDDTSIKPSSLCW